VLNAAKCNLLQTFFAGSMPSTLGEQFVGVVSTVIVTITQIPVRNARTLVGALELIRLARERSTLGEQFVGIVSTVIVTITQIPVRNARTLVGALELIRLARERRTYDFRR
jgi:hypothetical protein